MNKLLSVCVYAFFGSVAYNMGYEPVGILLTVVAALNMEKL